MDIERLAQEYLAHIEHAERLKKTIEEFKGVLIDTIIQDGEEDENGHQWLPAGSYLLQRQRRESRPTLDIAKAEQWAKDKGIWNEVSQTIEVLDQDALYGYIFDHKDTPGLEDEFQQLFTEPKVSYAFMKPTKVQNYDY